MNKLLTSLVLGLALTSTFGCSLLHPVAANVPGQVNSFDGDTYLSLSTAKGVIDQTKLDLANNAFPSSWVAKVKKALNDSIAAYNAADLTYQAYHVAAVAGTATPAQQAAVTNSVNNLNTTINAVTSAKAGN